MKTCNEVQKLIYPYLDGELDVKQNLFVEEHLVGCSECSDLLTDRKRFLTLLQSSSLREPAPARLREKISASLEGKKPFPWPRLISSPFKYTFGVAVALLLLFFFANKLPPGSDDANPFIQASVVSHENFLKGKLPLEFVSNDPEKVTKWLMGKIDFMVKLSNFKDDNVVIRGGRVLNFNGRPVGLVSYQVDNTPVSLLIVQKSAETKIESDDFTLVEERKINFQDIRGFNTVAWSVCSNNFTLVSTLPKKGEKSCNVCHAKGSGLSSLSFFYNRT